LALAMVTSRVFLLVSVMV
jgi:hypothetical protein